MRHAGSGWDDQENEPTGDESFDGRDDFDDECGDEGDVTDDEYDAADDVLPCPACGTDVYDDTDQCPKCGEWIMPQSGATRPGRWVAVVIVLMIGLMLVLTLL